MIMCDFIDVPRFVSNPVSPYKKGWYHNSTYTGVKNHIIAGYLDLDWTQYQETPEVLVGHAIEYLNSLTPRKYKNKTRIPKYGKLLSIVKITPVYNITDVYNKPCIQVMIETSQAKNKNFWGASKQPCYMIGR